MNGMGANHSDINTVELVIDLVGCNSHLITNMRLFVLCHKTRDYVRNYVIAQANNLIMEHRVLTDVYTGSDAFSAEQVIALIVLYLGAPHDYNKFPRLNELLVGACSDCDEIGNKGIMLVSACPNLKKICDDEKYVCVGGCKFTCGNCGEEFLDMYCGDWRVECKCGSTVARYICDCYESSLDED